MARQLYMEDQRQQDAAQAAYNARHQRPQHPGWSEGPYPAGAQSPGQERDTMAEITQQVNKFAESELWPILSVSTDTDTLCLKLGRRLSRVCSARPKRK